MDSNHLDLSHEFPELAGKITELKGSNNHFKRLYDEYTKINREIIRIEKRIELVSEADENQIRKQRLSLKDELYSMLTKEECCSGAGQCSK